jgi:S-adenosylmethionine decarboxylase
VEDRVSPISEAPETNDAPWGYQLSLDLFGCSFEDCCSLDRGYEYLDRICVHLEMTKQTQPYIFKTCDLAFPGKPGYSGWVPIIESGIQIHTSAHKGFISIDVYSCKPFDPQDVIDFTRNWFPCDRADSVLVPRGKGLLKTAFDKVPA